MLTQEFYLVLVAYYFVDKTFEVDLINEDVHCKLLQWTTCNHLTLALAELTSSYCIGIAEQISDNVT